MTHDFKLIMKDYEYEMEKYIFDIPKIDINEKEFK